MFSSVEIKNLISQVFYFLLILMNFCKSGMTVTGKFHLFFMFGLTMTLFIHIIPPNSSIFNEFRTKKLSTPVKPGTDSANRAIHKLGNFLVSKTFDIAKDNNRAEIFRERFDGTG